MDLLLLLTALIASLTGGAGSGERAVQRMPGVAVVHAAEAVQAAVQPARRAIPAVAVRAVPARAGTARPLSRGFALAAAYLPFERRLE